MLTPEDKAIISEYMGWCNHKYAKSGKLWGTGICIKCKDPLPLNHHFDSNDASLCVLKMIENGYWDVFYQNGMGQYALIDGRSGIKQQDYVAWLFNSQNFFAAMAAWLRSK